MMRVSRITDLDEASSLTGAWRSLMGRAQDPEPFLTPDWYLSWWKAFGSGRMEMVAVHRSGELVGVAPFRIERREIWGRKRSVLTLWSNPFSNRANVVLDRRCAEGVADAITDFLFTSGIDWELARLGPLRRESQISQEFQKSLSEYGARWGVRPRHSSPYLSLPDEWDDLLERLDGKFRRNLRRKERNAAEKDISFRFGGEAPEDIDPAFEVSRNTWQHEQGTGITSTPAIERFYRDLAKRASELGWLSVSYTYLESRPISYELNLEYGERLYNLKIGYDQDYRDLSPGRVLKQRVLRRAIDDDLKEYDFLGEAEDFKLRWTDDVRPLGELWIHRRGLAPRAIHHAYFDLKPFVESHFPWALELKRRVLDT